MPSYSTGPFAVVSVAQITTTVLRAGFNAPPLAVSNTGTTDALNPNNYALTNGIIVIIPVSVSITVGNNTSVDINFGTNLSIGSYQFHVYNVVGA